MYLADCDCDDDAPQLGSWLSKIVKNVTNVVTAPLKAAAAPVLSLQRKAENLIEKNTPNKLLPLVTRVHASVDRATEAALVPTEAPRLVRAEIKQIDDARKDPEFMKLVGTIMAVVAVVYPMLQPVASAMKLLQAAAERTAAKKLMAKDQAEADAAQREFDQYAAELARLQQEYATLQATPVAPSPSSTPMVAQPMTPSQPLPVASLAPRDSAQGIDREIERAAQAGVSLPPWLGPIAAVAAALFAIPILMPQRATTRRRKRSTKRS